MILRNDIQCKNSLANSLVDYLLMDLLRHLVAQELSSIISTVEKGLKRLTDRIYVSLDLFLLRTKRVLIYMRKFAESVNGLNQPCSLSRDIDTQFGFNICRVEAGMNHVVDFLRSGHSSAVRHIGYEPRSRNDLVVRSKLD